MTLEDVLLLYVKIGFPVVAVAWLFIELKDYLKSKSNLSGTFALGEVKTGCAGTGKTSYSLKRAEAFLRKGVAVFYIGSDPLEMKAIVAILGAYPKFRYVSDREALMVADAIQEGDLVVVDELNDRNASTIECLVNKVPTKAQKLITAQPHNLEAYNELLLQRRRRDSEEGGL